MNRGSFFALIAGVAGALLSVGSGCDGGPVTGTGGGGIGGAGGSTATGGADACTDAADCKDPLSGECKMWTCSAGTCAEENVQDGTEVATQQQGDCKKSVCMGGVATSENDDADVPDDMNDCTVDACNAGTPDSPPAEVGTACATGGGKLCDGAGACVECATSTDCPDPATPICSSAKECIAPLDNGQMCLAGEECLSGNCIDGVCCNSTCAATCRACDLPGTEGTCTTVPDGEDPNNECAGALSCSGNTACEKALGESCSTPQECGSNICNDGVCCDTACTGVCEACNIDGMAGTCSPYAAGTDPEGECANPNPNCDGAGMCGP